MFCTCMKNASVGVTDEPGNRRNPSIASAEAITASPSERSEASVNSATRMPIGDSATPA